MTELLDFVSVHAEWLEGETRLRRGAGVAGVGDDRGSNVKIQRLDVKSLGWT